ncbi:MAG TPA: nucleotidyltransferase domain-containing protein [Sandaracinaceae bacterium LLY-WYZ-13_1]|nr:nucleotidyltransferase domain-containing protein [Sandaracinaceae bacterium LLY-WYZ-13_1]
MPEAEPRIRLPEVCERVAAVMTRHPKVAVAYVFGSVARGDARADSDLDVGIVFAERHSGRTELLARLSGEISSATDIERVDVVDLEAQGPIFAHEVLLGGRRAHVGSEERRVDFESDTLVRAFDFRPTHEIATRGKVRALRRWLRERHDPRPDPVEAGRPTREPDPAG